MLVDYVPGSALCYLYIGGKTDVLVWEAIEIKNKGKIQILMSAGRKGRECGGRD